MMDESHDGQVAFDSHGEACYMGSTLQNKCRVMSDVYLNIHRAAQAAGVSPSALRLWESRGLVRPQKTPSGHRRYTVEDVGRIRDIRRLRSVQGLNLAAIQGVLVVNGTAPTQRASHGARAVGRALQALRLRRRLTRSEERRVGKECRSRGSPSQ